MIWTWRSSNPDWSWESDWEFLDGHSVENTQPKEKELEERLKKLTRGRRPSPLAKKKLR